MILVCLSVSEGTTLHEHACRDGLKMIGSPGLLLGCPCLTQEANDWWKFLSCWKDTGEPCLEARTILFPDATCPVLWPVDAGVPRVLGMLAEVVVVVVVEVVAVVLSLCSRRF